MATNLQNVLETLSSKTEEISRSEENWSAFLDSAARAYEYPFANQVLIHAQKPDVTACAEISAWNQASRFVKKGTRGIALLVEHNQRRYLKYVFDLNDTQESWRKEHGDDSSQSIPCTWEMRPEYEHVALSALQNIQPAEKDSQADSEHQMDSSILKKQLESVVYQLSQRVEPSSERKDEVKRLLESSVAYVVLSRCNMESDEYIKDFLGINNLSRKEVYELGNMVSKLSRRVLKLLEQSINSERSDNENARAKPEQPKQTKQREQDQVRESGRLFTTESHNTTEIKGATRQIRNDEKELLNETPSGHISHTPGERPAAGAPDGGRRSSGRAGGTDNLGNAQDASRAGQINATNGVGTAHEQPQSVSGGNSAERADISGSVERGVFESGRKVTEPVENNLFTRTSENNVEQTQSEAPSSQLSFDFNNLFPSGDAQVNTQTQTQAQPQPQLNIPLSSDSDNELTFEQRRRILEAREIDFQKRAERAVGSNLEEQAVILSFDPNYIKHLREVMQLQKEETEYRQAENKARESKPTQDIQEFQEVQKSIPSTLESILSSITWTNAEKTRVMIAEIPAMVLRDKTYLNAIHNSDEQSARDEFDITLRSVMLEIMSEDIELYKEFCDNPTFSKQLSDAVFNLTYQSKLNEIQESEEAKPAQTFEGLQYQEQSEQPIQPKQELLNFHIADDNLGVGGAKTKYNFNVSAIKLLKQIESENRLATSDEQEILSRYVGWGGIPQAFDKDKSDWSKEYEELKSILSDDEYKSARASTLNAHYTSPTVIKAIYGAIENMGFSKGNILEPSMGIGNFFGLLPESMSESKLYGVELDSVTGRIARQLYQNANITVSGYEKTSFPNNFFDLAIGNVPFGDYKVQDNKYDKLNFRIHDYFFAKTLDQVRPGGVVAFVTSKGTMDKANSTVRKYLAQRAELIAAIRLPNNVFMANAGTEVTTDIIFLQKRERQIDIEPDWAYLGKTVDGITVNNYFANNPHMILGRMVHDKSMYGNENETACISDEAEKNQTLHEQLEKAVSCIQGKFTERERTKSTKDSFGEADEAEQENIDYIPADPNVQNFTYALVDGELYYRENSLMTKPEMSAAAIERAKGLVQLRDCVRTLIEYQLHDYKDEEITMKQAELNNIYDSFTAQFGIINSRENKKAFKGDSAYYLLCSLENVDEQKKVHKADMFHKRTIKQKSVISSVDTAAEALAVSLAEKAKVDITFMSKLTGTDEGQIISELHNVIFQNPEKEDNGDIFTGYETADEYLSGNIREKLRIATLAAKDDVSYDINVQALKNAMPKELTAAEIDVRLGATWISPKHIEDFMVDTLDTPRYKIGQDIKVSFHSKSAEWYIEGKNRDYMNIKSRVAYGTPRMNAYKIIEETLNLRDIRIYDIERDSEDKERRVISKKETAIAQQKQELLKQAFKDWVFKDQKRRDELVQKYNEIFNSTRPREYDGSHLAFSGINPEVNLRKHQLNAIAHIMYGGNTLLAHTVGAGKTFEMIAAAMESKRLGLCQKSLFVVPNHLTEQTASEFMRLYPAANILVATHETFETKNRKKFCSRVATGDYDAVIIGHSQFEKIPMSKERQTRLLEQQIDEIIEAIEELRDSGDRFSVKQLERTKRILETRLSKLFDTKRKDDVITFEELGVDRIYVDEAHYYKNLFLVTKMRNVAGIPQSEAQKSSDLYAKCRYLDEITGGKGIIFATGTPVSNSMTELYTMMRYLQHDKLDEHGLGAFDAWASTFGETVTAIELAPEGTGYRARTRFAKFYNLPELMSMFKEVADIQTADMLDLPVPKALFHTLVAKPSQYQKDMVLELSERAEAVHNRVVEPYEDNMLKITTDGRKIGLDQRLINPMLPDDEDSKVNMCMRNIYEIWESTKQDKLTQLVFCDFSTPNKEERFNVYDDIKGKLIQSGIPENEIAYIHDAKTEQQKDELFAQVRNGHVRVLMGST
ncbi:MAG: SNF2-related protein, partial [Synergistaceae bacterium]|nr:SNF2-related protein [Synergistaceae bacterium]